MRASSRAASRRATPLASARIEEERAHLRALPVRPLPAYRESYATVSRASAVRILKHSYSVSSRLIGCQLRVRLHADIVELDYKGERVAVMERLVGRDAAPDRLPPHHPCAGAQARRLPPLRVPRGALPQLEFRRAYDALLTEGSDQADLDYVRILHLAASDGEETCPRGARGFARPPASVPTYEAVRAKVRGPRTPEGVPCLNITAPDLSVYDRLLGTNAEAVCA